MSDSTKPAPWLTIFGIVVSVVVVVLYFTSTIECGGVPEPPAPYLPPGAFISDYTFIGYECKNGEWYENSSGMFGESSTPVQ